MIFKKLGIGILAFVIGVIIFSVHTSEALLQKKTQGLLMFRGNETRNHYGTGNFTKAPQQAWKYPQKAMCSKSSTYGKTKTWCGTGWTGQPVIWDNPSTKKTEVIFGAYDRNVHFVDFETGEELRSVFKTNDLVKGSITMDPDGYPLIYFGSRDNYLRIVSLQEDGTTKEVWKLNANSRSGIWNNDWDGNPIIKNDIMYEGGENGWMYAIKLNRGYDKDGVVTVDPKIVFSAPLFNNDLIKKTDRNLSIESSPLITKNRLYLANSGGRVAGFDISKIETGVAPMVFDFWTGDDIDATLTTDSDGNIFATVEAERLNSRSKELGQLIKLNPYNKTEPIVWTVEIPSKSKGVLGGAWATPAHYKGYVYVVTNPGDLMIIESKTGKIVYQKSLGIHEWSSPSIVNDTLVLGLCSRGSLRAYDVKKDPTNPQLLWEKRVGETGGCVESTPALYNGTITVGSRDGFLYHFK